MSRLKAIVIGAALLLAAACPPAPLAQFSHPGCGGVAASEFAVVPLATNSAYPDLREPMKLALHAGPGGGVDVYFIQRYGMVRRYNGDARTVTTLLDLAYGADSIDAANSEGLIGMALDPGFRGNGWIYLFIGIEGAWRLSRFTLSGDRIQRASERVILRITTGSSRKHVAGPLRFDSEGNLWVGVADNENRFAAANTHSLLGKILRIRPRPFPDSQTPQPGPGSTYDVPAGNLFAAGTAGARPEIYVMGVRNPYSLAWDPSRKALAWGDVGPDNFSGQSTNPKQFTEEHNFTRRPGNFGWPYWAGNNIPLESGGGTPEAPVNNRGDNDGLKSLPPATPAIHPFARAAAITGPVYAYDGTSASTVKFPPHFHGAWFVADFNRSWVEAKALDPAGERILGTLRIVAAAGGLNNPGDMDFGADGALYVVNYFGYRTFSARTGIMRIEYRGSCRPVSLEAGRPLQPRAYLRDGRLVLRESAPARVELRSLDGCLEWQAALRGPGPHALPASLPAGLHFLSVESPAGRFTQKVVR